MTVLKPSTSKRNSGSRCCSAPSSAPSLSSVIEAYSALVRQWSALLTMIQSLPPSGYQVSLTPSPESLTLLVSPAQLSFQRSYEPGGPSSAINVWQPFTKRSSTTTGSLTLGTSTARVPSRTPPPPPATTAPSTSSKRATCHSGRTPSRP